MSRHIIPGKNDNHQVVVGWDAPMGTFFGQVFDKNAHDEDDDLVFGVGQQFNEMPEIGPLLEAMAPHADISPMVIRVLENNKAAEGDKSAQGKARYATVMAMLRAAKEG